MSWEYWIEKELEFPTGYDYLLENLCLKFKLKGSDRKKEVVDIRQNICIWYRKNQWKFSRYSSLGKVAELIGVHNHSAVTHISCYRDVSKRVEEYNYNTKEVEKELTNY